MTTFRLILRSLTHFRASSLAVVAGMAVATAVLAGSLMVGDSVRGSLKRLAIDRLGPVDYALVAQRFFDDTEKSSLAGRLAGVEGIAGQFDVIPAVFANGSASTGALAAGGSGPVGDVQILGVGGDWAKVVAGETILNGKLASDLGVSQPKVPPGVSFKLPSKEDAPREATVARRDATELSYDLPVGQPANVHDIARGRGMLAEFSLQGGQRTPRNAWVNLRELQEVILQPKRANALLVRDRTVDLSTADERTLLDRVTKASTLLNNAAKKVVRLDDYGLDLGTSKATGERYVSTKSTYLAPPVVTAAEQTARKLGVEPRLATVNLVNRAIVTDERGVAAAGAKELRFIIGAGVSHLDGAEDVHPGGMDNGTPLPVPVTSTPATTATAPTTQESTGKRVPLPMPPNVIVLNEETAKSLGVKVGDHLRLDYYRRESDGRLIEVTSAQNGVVFRVARIIRMKGIGADASLTPVFKGMTDAGSVSNWRAPAELNIDMDAAKASNEPYWSGDRAKGITAYGASPRLFISIETARKLWGGPYGDITSVRVPGDKAEAFAEELRQAIDPASLGFVFQPIKLQQLAASAGSTDFSGLFVGFSFFLIAAAVLLVAMLFRLNIEQRVRQFGVLAAVGFSPARVRWLALREGTVLAIIGGVLGIALGVGYTWVMVYGLRTWWVGAIGTTALDLHVEPVTLAIGFASGVLVAMLAVLWAVWRLGKMTPARLMAGQLAGAVKHSRREDRGRRMEDGSAGTTPSRSSTLDPPSSTLLPRDGRVSRLTGILLAIGGIAFLGLVFAQVIRKPEMALAGGAILLMAGLFYLAGTLRPRRHPAGSGDVRSVAMLGVRNANRHTARSVLSVGLIAFAAFTLITVASMQKNSVGDTGDPKIGAGGYRLIVQAAVPILHDLNDPLRPSPAASTPAPSNAAEDGRASSSAGRRQAGFREPDAEVWKDVRFAQLRRWAGQDISCLNLTRPTSPTILGVPHTLVERNAFQFSNTLERADNPWTLLEKPPASGGPVPVFADHETAAYILKLGLGDTLSITDQLGRQRQLQLVGTLDHSIFQSELLMSEASFRELFPAQAGYGTLLVECPPEKQKAVFDALNTELEPYAASVDTTAARLEAYQRIQNTYLSTFAALGSLGLALGTIGLAVVLIRNVIERRGELALLSAIGFAPGSRVRLVLVENVMLLALGLGVGTICALLGIVPTLLTSKTNVSWGSLGLTMLGVFALGLFASVLAVWLSGVRGTPKDLRSE